MASLIIFACIIIILIAMSFCDHLYRKNNFAQPENIFGNIAQWAFIATVICLLVLPAATFIKSDQIGDNLTELESEYCPDWYVIYQDETNNKFYRPYFVTSEFFVHYEMRELNSTEMKKLAEVVQNKNSETNNLFSDILINVEN